MGQKRIKAKHRARAIVDNSQPVATKTEFWKDPDWGGYFTAILNAAFAKFAKLDTQKDKHRVFAWMVRSSWGNWHAEPMKSIEPEPEIPIDESSWRELLFGRGACPLCDRTVAKQDTPMPPKFRWHYECLSKAYARDAVRLGDQEQQEWGNTVLKSDH